MDSRTTYDRATARPPGRKRTVSRIVPLAMYAFLLSLGVPSPASARQGQHTDPGTDVGRLLDAVDDIDHLRYLDQLNLTADQLDRTIAAVKSAQSAFHEQLLKLAQPLTDLADQIRSTKKSALAGDAPSKAFDDRVKKIESEFLAGRDKLDAHTLSTMSAAIRDILTRDQFATAVMLTKEYRTEQGQSTSGTDAQWFNLFVLNHFVSFPRTVDLLKEMRQAKK